jgi:multicomponent K+:H+ antiporter subunit A
VPGLRLVFGARLALTQLLVEVATVLLMMLALRWLPAQSPPLATAGARLKAWRDAALALAVGLGVAALVWQVLARPGVSIADYYLQTTRAGRRRQCGQRDHRGLPRL